ncbi:hypothetical protein D5S18_03055 [Nocardia panacis]|uniref:Uncharacterized protein n=1 Tax=Nocardia panacis TaxID=2340916 RepID=A0A3A4KZE4_9NOCA|nr:hypothetical protein [Nocardia panacis]RJO79324.1 hypothetical protein D5S18_03055 [Nocardia panacis]
MTLNLDEYQRRVRSVFANRIETLNLEAAGEELDHATLRAIRKGWDWESIPTIPYGLVIRFLLRVEKVPTIGRMREIHNSANDSWVAGYSAERRGTYQFAARKFREAAELFDLAARYAEQVDPPRVAPYRYRAHLASQDAMAVDQMS